MGIVIKRKGKKFRLISSVSDECYHPEKRYVTEKEAKQILIDLAFFNFMQKVVEIGLKFPDSWFCDGIYIRDEEKAEQWRNFLKESLNAESCTRFTTETYLKIKKELDIDLDIC